MKCLKSVEFKTSRGQTVTIKIEVTKEVIDNIVDADGNLVNLGKKAYENTTFTVYIDGTYKFKTTSLSLVDGNNSDFAKRVKAAGGVAFLENLVLTEKNYQKVLNALNEANQEVVNEEYENLVAEEVQKENEEIINEAKKIVKLAQKEGIENLLTEADLIIWRENYNNLHNEGVEGYIPYRVSKEAYTRAKTILNN